MWGMFDLVLVGYWYGWQYDDFIEGVSEVVDFCFEEFFVCGKWEVVCDEDESGVF